MKKFAIVLAAAGVLALGVTGFQRNYALRFRDAINLRVHRTERRARVIVTGGMTHSGMTVTRTTTAVSDHRC